MLTFGIESLLFTWSTVGLTIDEKAGLALDFRAMQSMVDLTVAEEAGLALDLHVMLFRLQLSIARYGQLQFGSMVDALKLASSWHKH